MQNTNNEQLERVKSAIETLIQYAGDDITREGLCKTPERVAKAYLEYFKGYLEDPAVYLATQFHDVKEYVEPVLLQNIPFYSHCEHHIAPIHGTVSISYIPDQRIVGISKLARVVETFARRLQVQEKLTTEIAECIQKHLQPKGVAVYVNALHHCMMGRGVNVKGASMITYHFTGIYQHDEKKRHEFKQAINAQ